jgi:hypothetical protein
VGAKACRSCESEASRKEERFKEDSGQEDNRQEIGAEGSEEYGHASATRRGGWWRIDDQLVTAIPSIPPCCPEPDPSTLFLAEIGYLGNRDASRRICWNPLAQAPYATDPVGGYGKPRRADGQAPLEPNCLLYLQNAGLRPQ